MSLKEWILSLWGVVCIGFIMSSKYVFPDNFFIQKYFNGIFQLMELIIIFGVLWILGNRFKRERMEKLLSTKHE